MKRRLLTVGFTIGLCVGALVACSDSASNSKSANKAHSTAALHAANSKYTEAQQKVLKAEVRFGEKPGEIVEFISMKSPYHSAKLLKLPRQYRYLPGAHVVQLPAAYSVQDNRAALIFFALKQAGADDARLVKFFNAMAQAPSAFETDAGVLSLVKAAGVSSSAFLAAVTSPEVRLDALKARAMTRAVEPASVPGVLVKGKVYVSMDHPLGVDQAVSSLFESTK